MVTISSSEETELRAAIEVARKREEANERLQLLGHDCNAFAKAPSERRALEAKLADLHKRGETEAAHQEDQRKRAEAIDFAAVLDAHQRMKKRLPELQKLCDAADVEADAAMDAIRPTEAEVRSFKPGSAGLDRFMIVVDDGYGNLLPPRPLIHNENAPDADERYQRSLVARSKRDRAHAELNSARAIILGYETQYEVLRGI
jgi:hypothetical protein